MSVSTVRERNGAGGWRLPFAFLSGPIAWGLQLLIGYVLVPVACVEGVAWPVHGLGLVAGLVTLAAGYVALRSWQHLAERGHADIIDVDKPVGTRTFLAVSGTLLSAVFFVLILVTGVAALFLNACPIITMPVP